MLGGWEVIIVCSVLMLFFGFRRLPSAARDLGRSLRILRAETAALHDDDDVASES